MPMFTVECKAFSRESVMRIEAANLYEAVRIAEDRIGLRVKVKTAEQEVGEIHLSAVMDHPGGVEIKAVEEPDG